MMTYYDRCEWFACTTPNDHQPSQPKICWCGSGIQGEHANGIFGHFEDDGKDN